MQTGRRIVDLVTESCQPCLWHVYPRALDDDTLVLANGFNPRTRGRFAAGEAAPPRAMFYAGSTPECALWETPPLRDVIGRNGRVVLSTQQFGDRRLAQMRARRPLHLVDLDIKRLRSMVASAEVLDEVEELKHSSPARYWLTHVVAQEILAVAAEREQQIDGLMWRSKQHGGDTVYVLYSPPASSSDLELIDGSEVELDNPRQGWPVIDAALAQAGLARVTVDGRLGDHLAEDRK